MGAVYSSPTLNTKLLDKQSGFVGIQERRCFIRMPTSLIRKSLCNLKMDKYPMKCRAINDSLSLT